MASESWRLARRTAKSQWPPILTKGSPEAISAPWCWDVSQSSRNGEGQQGPILAGTSLALDEHIKQLNINPNLSFLVIPDKNWKTVYEVMLSDNDETSIRTA